MEFQRATLETCAAARGTVVVIDVIRAFTTAAYAFAAGAETITLVGTVEEALALRGALPGVRAMGEVGGKPIPGFDLSNSPAEVAGCNLAGVHMVQRTSHGVQGFVRSRQAETLFGGSLVCAGATARYIRRLAPQRVTFVITGVEPDGSGDEDAACADYLEALLCGEQPDPQPFIRRVRNSVGGRIFASAARPEFPAADLDLCAAVDRFDFALPVERVDGLLVMRAVKNQ